MFLYHHGKRPAKPLLYLIAGILICLTIMYTYTVPVYAEDTSAPASGDPAADPDPDPGPSVRIPGFPMTVSSTLSHTHRGDASAEGQCYTVPVIHYHTGDSASGGACYSPHYHSHGGGCYSSCSYSPSSMSFTGSESTYCNVHGPTLKSNYTVIVQHHGCGRTEYRSASVGCSQCGGNPADGMSGSHSYLTCSRGGSIEYYDMTCGMTEGSDIDHYDPGCGLDVTDYGTLSLNNTTPEWTSGNVSLQGILSDPEGVICDGGFGAMTFDALSGEITDTSSDSITVSENGTYTLSISVDEARFDTAQASVMLNVANIDRTEPDISSVSYNTGEAWIRTNEITVSAVDLQPDGTPGSGLADEAYSFDGGHTWQSSPVYVCTENGTVDICVRDYCGNAPLRSIDITNIDNTGPDVSYIFTPNVWYQGDGDREYTFTAVDEEAGLPDMPFSYDGGETWTDEVILATPEAGSFTVLVRDNLGNITEVTIDNRYSTRPSPSGGDDDDPHNPPADGGSGDGSGQDDGGGDGSGRDKDDKDGSGDADDTDGSGGSSDGSSGSSTGGGDDGDKGNGSGDASGDGDGRGDDNADTDGSEASVYFEQLPTSSAGVDISGTSGVKAHTPFYRTTAFKAAASVGGGLLGCGILVLMFLLLYSGVIVYTYDGDRYRLNGLKPVRRSERGNYIFLSGEFMDNTYSSRYKFRLGRIYVARHRDELLGINADGEWSTVSVERFVYTVLKHIPRQ